jgi:hypothetical protein
MRYTPTHASLNQPIESAQKAIRFRTVSAALVHGSRTITRTLSAHHAPEPFGQLSIPVNMCVCVAKENLSLVMLTSTSVTLCPPALNASPVRPELVLGFLSTALHTTIVTSEPFLGECPRPRVGVRHHENHCSLGSNSSSHGAD